MSADMVEVMQDAGELERLLGDAAASPARRNGRRPSCRCRAPPTTSTAARCAGRSWRSSTSACASACVKTSEAMSLTPIIGVMPILAPMPRSAELLLGGDRRLDGVLAHLAVVVDRLAVIHGHDVDHVDAHAVMLGALQHGEPAGDRGRSAAPAAVNDTLRSGLAACRPDDRLVAQGDRMLVLLRRTLDVEVDRVDVIAVDHRLVFGLQDRSAGRGQRRLLAGRAAERDGDVAARRLDRLHLLTGWSCR